MSLIYRDLSREITVERDINLTERLDSSQNNGADLSCTLNKFEKMKNKSRDACVCVEESM